MLVKQQILAYIEGDVCFSFGKNKKRKEIQEYKMNEKSWIRMSLNRTKNAWGEDSSFLTTHPKIYKHTQTQKHTLSHTHAYK